MKHRLFNLVLALVAVGFQSVGSAAPPPQQATTLLNQIHTMKPPADWVTRESARVPGVGQSTAP